jgi:hypothetical protein
LRNCRKNQKTSSNLALSKPQGLIDIAPSASVIVRIIRGGLAPPRYNAAQRLFTGDSGAPYQNHAGLVLFAGPSSE